MNLTKKITLALGLAAGAASYAQTTPATTATNGLLGHRYTEISFGLEDIKHFSDHGYSLGASANNPIIPGKLDAGASYSYSWINGALKGHANTVGAYATAYLPLRGVKPFVGTALGYQWSSFRWVGSDEKALWGATTGVEIPAGPVTLTPRISYVDDFEGSRESTQAWDFQVEANYWFNQKSAVFASIGKSEVVRSSVDSWNYTIGLRARF
jgi:hypothetical protein